MCVCHKRMKMGQGRGDSPKAGSSGASEGSERSQVLDLSDKETP